MRRLIILLTLCFCSSAVVASVTVAPGVTGFSNMIVFGDSLSDVGNFPEISNVYMPPSTTKPVSPVDSVYTSLYIPVNNPVDLSASSRVGYYPTSSFITDSKLPSQPLVTYKVPNGNGFYGRKGPHSERSFIWPQYFLADAIDQSLTTTHDLIPWINVANGAQASANDSVDYAWFGALSNDQCANDNQDDVLPAACTRKQIITTWQAYNNNTLPDGARVEGNDNLKEKVSIPGLLKQIDLFQTDLANKKVVVDTNTLYTIWIGGNDLRKDFAELKSGKTPLKAIYGLLFGIAWNNYLAINKLIKSVGAQNILLFDTYNPTYTPQIAQDWPPGEQKLAVALMTYYCASLKAVVELVHILHPHILYPNLNIRLVPIYTWFHEMEEGKYTNLPKLNLKLIPGKACEIQDPLSVSGPNYTNNCYTNNSGYMFWNGIHPAMPAEQIIADDLVWWLQSSYKLTLPDNAALAKNALTTDKAKQAFLLQQLQSAEK